MSKGHTTQKTRHKKSKEFAVVEVKTHGRTPSLGGVGKDAVLDSVFGEVQENVTHYAPKAALMMAGYSEVTSEWASSWLSTVSDWGLSIYNEGAKQLVAHAAGLAVDKLMERASFLGEYKEDAQYIAGQALVIGAMYCSGTPLEHIAIRLIAGEIVKEGAKAVIGKFTEMYMQEGSPELSKDNPQGRSLS